MRQEFGRVGFPRFERKPYNEICVVKDRREQIKTLHCTCGGALRNFSPRMRDQGSRGCCHIRVLFTGSESSPGGMEDIVFELTEAGRLAFHWRWAERALTEAP